MREVFMYKYIIGCDNGTTGRYCIMSLDGQIIAFEPVPIFNHPGWSKPKKVKKTNKEGLTETKIKQTTFNFIDINKLRDAWSKIPDLTQTICYLERPAVNYQARWSMQTSLSAFGAWQAVIYVLKDLNIPYEIIDSRQWQTILIPQALGKNNKEYVRSQRKLGKRNDLLKKAADDFAHNLFPEITRKDCDSICIAECFRRIIKHNQDLTKENL
jgi:hypothetical protein